MKQKIVIKVDMHSDKCRSKAMKLVAATGVDSVTLEGDDKTQLVVVGEQVDSIKLTCLLRKKVGHADIVKVEGVEEVKKDEEPKPNECSSPCRYWPAACPPHQPLMLYEHRSSNSDVCSIM